LTAFITLAAASQALAADYIVLYDSSAKLNQALSEQQTAGNKPDDVFRSAVKGFVAPLSAAEAAELRSDEDVLLVEKDSPVKVLGQRSGSPWGLDRIDQRAHSPLDGSISTSQDGAGVTAYIVDTGIRITHQQFGSRASVGFDTFGGTGIDCHGHGTHVAGTVAGSSYGVAPAASLVAVRVMDCGGSGTVSGIIAGLDWIVANHVAGAPAVANMSIGGGYSLAENLAVQRAIDDGVTMAVAAGNENSDACGTSPASAPNALTVGASASSDARASFSNYGSCLDIFAPGVSVLSAWHASDTSTGTLNGTSMASPHVAGAAALLLSANPLASPAAVRSSLLAHSTAAAVTAPGFGSPTNLLYVGDPNVPQPAPPEPPAAPANDNFADAQTLYSLSTRTGSNQYATRQTDEPYHGASNTFNGVTSVWYRWTAEETGTLTLKTEGSEIDTIMAAYSGGALSSLTKLATNDDYQAPERWSRISFHVTAGVSYSIAVDGFSGAGGAVAIGGSFLADPPPPPPVAPEPDPPANDNFAQRAAFNLESIALTNVGSTEEEGEPAHVVNDAEPAKSVWYSWTATADGVLRLSTEGSAFDTMLAAYTGDSLTTLSEQGRNDDFKSGSNWSGFDISVVKGTSYMIVIDGFRQATGAAVLAGSFVASPPPETPTPPATQPVTPPPPPAAAPDTIITAAPASPSYETLPSISFTSDVQASFECRLDSAQWSACQNPYYPSSPLVVGQHSFDVRAINSEGLPDPTPSSLSFRIEARPVVLLPGRLNLVSSRLLVTGRKAVLKVKCTAAAVNSRPCVAALSLATTAGKASSSKTLQPGASSTVNFTLTVAAARRIAKGRPASAYLSIKESSLSSRVKVTLRKR
jgi:subtilisin family serine protease